MNWSNLLKLDNQLSNIFTKLDNFKPLHWLMLAFAYSGELWVWLILFLALGIVSNNYNALVAVIVTAIFNKSIKYLFKRRRPADQLSSYYAKFDPHSFPSSHSARAGVILTVALWQLSGWLLIAGVIYAIGVMLSRLVLKMHYLSDVLAGLVVGVGITCLTYLLV